MPPKPSAWGSETACLRALACLLASSQDPRAPVDRNNIPGEPAPLLHPHPSEQGFLSYYGPVRQRAPRRYSMPTVSASARSLQRPLGPATPDAISTLAFSRSVQEPQTRITPPLRRAPPGRERGHPPSSSRGKGAGPPISMPSLTFDASTTTPHRVSPAERFWKRLPGPHLTGSSPAFSLDAHHDSRQLTQLQGGLTPTPAGPTPEGQRSSISRTAPLSRVTYMDTPSAFVTHTPRHLGVTSGRPGRSGR